MAFPVKEEDHKEAVWKSSVTEFGRKSGWILDNFPSVCFSANCAWQSMFLQAAMKFCYLRGGRGCMVTEIIVSKIWLLLF